MGIMNGLVVGLAAYLLGSIPFGFLLVKLTSGKDIRSMGSGNIGATNVMRTGKKGLGTLTYLLDTGKGYLAVSCAYWLMGSEAQGWAIVAAMLAILGHVFPIFLRFKGGKGVATGCGAYLAVAPIPVLGTLVVFTLVVLTTRYVSLSSILATLSFPLWSWVWLIVLGHSVPHPWVVIIGAIPGIVLIVACHHANIRRLLRGEENRIGRKA